MYPLYEEPQSWQPAGSEASEANSHDVFDSYRTWHEQVYRNTERRLMEEL